jgi:hypothetical protein
LPILYLFFLIEGQSFRFHRKGNRKSYSITHCVSASECNLEPNHKRSFTAPGTPLDERGVPTKSGL